MQYLCDGNTACDELQALVKIRVDRCGEGAAITMADGEEVWMHTARGF